MGDLYPLLYKSQVWFKSIREVLRRENMGFEVGSGDLEGGSSSNVGGEGARVDTQLSCLLTRLCLLTLQLWSLPVLSMLSRRNVH